MNYEIKYLNETDRVYRMCLITYASEDEIRRACAKAHHYAYIFHDLDDNEPHYHVLLTFKGNTSLSSVKKYMNSNQNTLGQYMIDKTASFLYLTHEYEEDKIIYPDECVICDDRSFWESVSTDKEKDNEIFLDDLMTLSNRNMAIKYGRDFIRYFKQYDYFRSVIEAEDDKNL